MAAPVAFGSSPSVSRALASSGLGLSRARTWLSLARQTGRTDRACGCSSRRGPSASAPCPGSSARRTVDAHRPGRAVPGQRLLLEARDLGIRRAREIVEALVVLAHMREAEAEVLALLHAVRPARGGCPVPCSHPTGRPARATSVPHPCRDGCGSSRSILGTASCNPFMGCSAPRNKN